MIELKPINFENFMRWDGIKHIYPPHPLKLKLRSDIVKPYENDNHIVEIKINDSRIELRKHNDKLEFMDRRGNLLDYTPTKEILKILKRLPNGIILDGGIIHKKHSAIKNKLVFWDVIVQDYKILDKTNYADRRKILEKLLNMKTFKGNYQEVFSEMLNLLKSEISVFIMPQTNTKNIVTFFNLILKEDPFLTYHPDNTLRNCMFEGLVIKNLQANLKYSYDHTPDDGSMIKFRRSTRRHSF